MSDFPDHDIPEAAGERLPWESVPDSVRRAIEDELGSPIVGSASQRGGFSPGAAVRLTLTDGRRAFVKAAGPLPNPRTADMHRREAQVARQLPEDVPAPRLLFVVDDGEWVALCFEHIAGRQPHVPWRAEDLNRVLDAVGELADVLSPAPFVAPSIADQLGERFVGFRTLASARQAGSDDLADLDPWLLRNLGRLAQLEATWETAAEGDSLLHVDLRADNLLLTPDRVFAVDWPHAGCGARWFDLVCMLPSVRMQGGPDPEEIIAAHRVARGVSPRAIDSVICSLAGYFVVNGRKPSPPGLPTLRRFQSAQGEHAVSWLRRRVGWP